MHNQTTILLFNDASLERQATYANIAASLGLELMPCPKEAQWRELIPLADSLAVLVIGPDVPTEESFRLIEHIRLSPFYASLPIVLIQGKRDLDAAVQAMDAGVTEIFLETDHLSLQEFVATCVTAFNQPVLSGMALLVEDDENFAEYVSSLCNTLGFQVIVADHVEQAIEAMQNNQFQIVITDVVLKGTKSGLTLLRYIHQHYGNKFPVIVTSGYDDLPRRLMALKNGVGDFISKPFAGEEFIWRVQRVMQLAAMNETASDASVKSDHSTGMRSDISQLLSPREFEIFSAMIKGNSDKTIAASLGISYWTVRTHVQQIFAKTGAINRRELMARFISQSSDSGQ